MRIESIEALAKRLDKVIDEVSKDQRYVESHETLMDIREELDIYDLDENKEHLSMGLHEADGAYPMHPEVARLLIDFYTTGIMTTKAIRVII